MIMRIGIKAANSVFSLRRTICSKKYFTSQNENTRSKCKEKIRRRINKIFFLYHNQKNTFQRILSSSPLDKLAEFIKQKKRKYVTLCHHFHFLFFIQFINLCVSSLNLNSRQFYLCNLIFKCQIEVKLNNLFFYFILI